VSYEASPQRPNPASCRVKHYAAVSATARKIRQDKKLAPWYAIHDLNYSGHDFLDPRNTIANLVSVVCYSERTMYYDAGELWNLPALPHVSQVLVKPKIQDEMEKSNG
jgi:hypothetical protein